MKKITSRQNPEIINLAKLHDAKKRYTEKRFLAEGLRICQTLLEAEVKLLQIYVTEESIDKVDTFVDENLITIVSRPVMEKISAASTPSGIVGVFTLPKQPPFAQLDAGIVLADITDPGNMGTLIRTCIAMGKKTIVIVEGVDPWNPKVIQASAGTIGKATLFQCTWQELMDHKKNLALAALIVHGGSSLETIDKKVLLVIGNEARGIRSAWLKECEQTITLSMPGNVESLNAAVAGSIAMYELWSK
ncbi:MAG: TrmH family RNA methyltransferase [Candidatus Babeliales bacterium]